MMRTLKMHKDLAKWLGGLSEPFYDGGPTTRAYKEACKNGSESITDLVEQIEYLKEKLGDNL